MPADALDASVGVWEFEFDVHVCRYSKAEQNKRKNNVGIVDASGLNR